MDRDFFDIKSSKLDSHQWNNIPYKKGENGIYLPESDVISLHSGWSDMHFHIFNRIKYTMFINFYDVRDSRETRVQSGDPTVEYSMMLANQVFNHLGGLKPVNILQGFFNITYLPFVDSIVRFEKGQFYCTLDIHLKEEFLNELLIDFPSVMEPLLNSMAHKEHKRVFTFHVPCTLFMSDLGKSILQSLKRGPEFMPLVDKDVEALIAHAVAYKMDTNLLNLDAARTQLLNDVYNAIIADPAKFPGLEKLRKIAQTNSTTLNNLFKETFKITMKQCWIKYRLDKALYMVVHERNKKITEIGEHLGYTCLENFTKAFKAQHKHTPSFFRKDLSDFDSFFQANL